MAAGEPTVARELTEEEVNRRRDILCGIIGERDKVEDQKASQTKAWNEQLKLCDEQISTLGKEIRERQAWVPAQLGHEGLGTGEDDDDDGFGESADALLSDPDLAPTAKKKRKRASKKR